MVSQRVDSRARWQLVEDDVDCDVSVYAESERRDIAEHAPQRSQGYDDPRVIDGSEAAEAEAEQAWSERTQRSEQRRDGHEVEREDEGEGCEGRVAERDEERDEIERFERQRVAEGEGCEFCEAAQADGAGDVRDEDGADIYAERCVSAVREPI